LLCLLNENDERCVSLAPNQQGLPVERRGCLGALLLLLLLLLLLSLLLLLLVVVVLLLLLLGERVVMMVVMKLLLRRRWLILLSCERHEEGRQGGRVGRGRRRGRP
jgi:hypothetical protein